MQTTQTELLTKLTQVGNTLDQLDFRESPELTQGAGPQALASAARDQHPARGDAQATAADGCLNDIQARIGTAK